jgi:hypothetical protein
LPYNDEPKWVSGRLGSLTLEPPITHPGLCPCKQRPAYREKRAARLGLPMEQVVREPIDIRVKRNSPFPRNRALSKEAAVRLKNEEEQRLRDLVAGVLVAGLRRFSNANFATLRVSNFLSGSPETRKPPKWRLIKCFTLAGPTGLEPATSGVTGRRSNQLNYDPAVVGNSANPLGHNCIPPGRRASYSGGRWVSIVEEVGFAEGLAGRVFF